MNLAVNDRFEQKALKLTESSQKCIVGRSPGFVSALEMAKSVAMSSAHVLITGESGTGKEVFAKYIHSESKQKKGQFVAINCSAIPEHLLESELFGHSKGAFTGAISMRMGLFEEAQDGTLFLDEIGDLSLPLQAKLLRVLQEKTIKRVGENQSRTINCRIISATHKNLAFEMKEKRFREDLFFRLSVIPIHIPPLRERKEDLMPLAHLFLEKYVTENSTLIKSFSTEAVHFIQTNSWVGNVRELENCIERAVVLSKGFEIKLEDLTSVESEIFEDSALAEVPMMINNTFSIQCLKQLPTLDEVVRRYIEVAVTKKGGARDQTAKEIGIDRKTLYKKMRTMPSNLNHLQFNV